MSHRRPLLTALGLVIVGSIGGVGAFAQSSDASAPAASPAASVPPGPTVAVVAVDYAFQGLPSSVPVGTSLTLRNDGKELHELLVARKNDGVTESWDELIAMPEDQSMSKVTVYGPLVAAPGSTGSSMDGGATTIVLDAEGDYLAVCFVPQGMTSFPDPSASPDPAASFGPPHFALGMRQEFTVTAPGTSPGPVPSAMPMASPAASPAG